jgi:hypothetical protein
MGMDITKLSTSQGTKLARMEMLVTTLMVGNR